MCPGQQFMWVGLGGAPANVSLELVQKEKAASIASRWRSGAQGYSAQRGMLILEPMSASLSSPKSLGTD